jgi:hypothetical protein
LLAPRVFDGAEREHVVGQLLPVAMSEERRSRGRLAVVFPVPVCRSASWVSLTLFGSMSSAAASSASSR